MLNTEFKPDVLNDTRWTKVEKAYITASKYFTLFSAKDLEGLDEMFDSKATLRDWDIEAFGKSNIFIAMKDVFDSVESIEVNPIEMGCWANMELRNEEGDEPIRIVAELEITIDKTEKISVVDIIEFTNDYKIRGIKAFKG